MKSRVFLSCEEATKLASERHDRALSRAERWSLGVHLFLCAKCRRFVQQLGRMRRMLSQWAADLRHGANTPTLSEERREAIRRELRQSRP
jgi:predicted anti-sigma-YlaC factor YlaD